MAQPEKIPEKIRIPFAFLPIEAQKIIGTFKGSFESKPAKEWSLRQVRQAQALNRFVGNIAIEGKAARTLRFYRMEKRRLRRAVEAMERTGFFQPQFAGMFPPGWTNPANIAKTHPVVSITRTGDVVLRQPSKEEIANRSRQGFGVGRQGFVLGKIRAEPRLAQAIAERAKQREQYRAEMLQRRAIERPARQARLATAQRKATPKSLIKRTRRPL
ncbi:MAG: hypothetical protein QXK06_01925 [Candidatus Diapherotrites archaeon]